MSFLSVSPFLLTGTHKRRSGFGVTEIIVALLLLGMSVSYILPILNDLGRMQRRIEKQTLLQETAVNLIEELHTFSPQQLQELDAVRKQLETGIDTDDYELLLNRHSGETAGDRMRLDLELQPRRPQTVLSSVKFSTWISVPQTTPEAS